MINNEEENSQSNNFDKNVFINCPFDEEYKSLLRPLLFTIIYLGYNPRISSERSDSTENRIDKICELINESKYGIHDLSRIKSKESKEYFRLNMPFELGIDYGARRFGPQSISSKQHLILEKDPYAYKIAISDLSGVDIKDHKDEPDEIVRAVRDWFYDTVGLADSEFPLVIWNRYTDFTTDLFESRYVEGLTEHEVTEDIERMIKADPNQEKGISNER